MTKLEEKLARWTVPSSESEQTKQDRTERMIRDALARHHALAGVRLKVYAKGSYRNNTNVRSDSDVDIAVECMEAQYWNEKTPGSRGHVGVYAGQWTPPKLRAEVTAALKAKFGSDVDASGSTAIQVHSSTARVEADVVPCFDYRYYVTGSRYLSGAKVFKTDGSSVVNYSARQLQYGTDKNNATNYAYKKVVRILKRVENAMVSERRHREVPSFFIECLVFNCPNPLFARATWTERVKGALAHIIVNTDGGEPTDASERWVEVNRAKYLFAPSQKWTRKDAREFALAAWVYLSLTDA